MFRRAVLIVICFALICSAALASQVVPAGDDARVIAALDALKVKWTEHAALRDSDGYMRIINTRVVQLKEGKDDFFEGVDCIVEFVFFTDYLGQAPYYTIPGVYDSVAVYEDGSCKVQATNMMDQCQSRCYKVDYSENVESVTDYGDAYNDEFYLRAESRRLRLQQPKYIQRSFLKWRFALALRPARPVICIWATCAPRSIPICTPVAAAANSSCALRIPTRNARLQAQST